MNNLKEDIDYKISDADAEGNATVTLLKEYPGVTVLYGKLSFGEDKGEDTLDCSFEYEIIDPTTYTTEELEGSQTFVNLLGDVLITMLEASLLLKSLERNGNNREDNPQEPDME